ncbi:class V aminotransferase [Virgisporangium aliadipatigenens]|uniref:Class V aminotransferase n=1 Tax=Virgisporangium aliadipatigenens TaxID=741659 RepID=A0A8J3YKS0_9ACTN|nr:aminotransferase class V-fold PLP-dependent enzyme [Virgisporangium aliadipatigenens]GIJ47179.1 class V aminotransferase [Virgisporangium aliadipatigenens]
MVGRRELIAGGTLAALAACGPKAKAPAAPFDASDWSSVRAQFGLERDKAHFAAFVFASHPASVRARIAEHAAGLDRDPVGYLGRHEEELEARVVERAAAYLGVPGGEVAFTDSTTAGLGLLYSGLKLGPGDEILTTEHDFYATHESLRLVAARTGAVVRKVRLYADAARATTDEIVSAFTAALTPSVKVVALTWVHSGTGVRLPVRALADAARSRTQALICLDAVHGFGCSAGPVTDLGVDFFVSGCHKWLFGPRGTGLVWGSAEAWRRYTPVVPSFSGAGIGAWLDGTVPAREPGPLATPGGYHTFEHRWALAEAFDFHTTIGRDRVAQRTAALQQRLADGLRQIPTVTVHTPKELSAGLVCCELSTADPTTAVGRLYEQGVLASATPYRERYLRLGTSIATDETDVDRALAAIRAL